MKRRSATENMREQFSISGRGLIVFSDPGGAKPVLSVVKKFQEQIEYKILSDRKYKFFEEFELIIDEATESPDYYINQFNPDFILTGTSYTSNIELQFIKAAQRKKILTYSYVDHYTSIKERFNLSGEYIFPETILLQDSDALKIAMELGIPNTILKVIGNPYLKFINKWVPKVEKEIFLTSIGINDDQRSIILYAPDPLSNIDGIHKFGFDEIKATESINEIAGVLKKDFVFIFKPHPNQNMEVFNPSSIDNLVLVDKMTNTNLLIYYSEIIIGFISTILIEALEHKKKVIRFIPLDIKNDPLINYLKMSIINNPKNLIYELNK